MTVSRDTLQLCADLVSQVTLPANIDPDVLVAQATMVAQARRELAEALAAEES